MAHFQAGCQGSRGPATRLGGAKSLPRAFVNGWDAGVEVVGLTDERGDYFEVSATGGSNGRVAVARVGVIRVEGGKLQFEADSAARAQR